MLWSDQLGEQTSGINGGYGYCMGPAVCGDYVVAGGLVYRRRRRHPADLWNQVVRRAPA